MRIFIIYVEQREIPCKILARAEYSLLYPIFSHLTSKNMSRLSTLSPPNGTAYMNTRYIQVM